MWDCEMQDTFLEEIQKNKSLARVSPFLLLVLTTSSYSDPFNVLEHHYKQHSK